MPDEKKPVAIMLIVENATDDQVRRLTQTRLLALCDDIGIRFHSAYSERFEPKLGRPVIYVP